MHMLGLAEFAEPFDAKLARHQSISSRQKDRHNYPSVGH